MILIDATGYPNPKIPLAFKLSRNPITKYLVRHIGARSLIEKSLKEVYADDSKITDELIERYYEINLREGNRAAYISRANIVFETDVSEIKQIAVQTLILWGSEDVWSPAEYAKRFHQDLPNSELIFYEGVGHIPMEEIPEKSAQDAKVFLLDN